MQMNTRERMLAFIVGTLVVVMITYMLVGYLMKQQHDLMQQIKDKTVTLTTMKSLVEERPTWEARDQWLRQNQPKLDNANSAGVALLEQLKTIGQTHGLTPTEAQIGTPDANSRTVGKGSYQAFSVSFTVKGKWEDLVGFLYDAQTPTNFLVFEKATLQLDKEDKTQVAGNFKLAKWYAVQ